MRYGAKAIRSAMTGAAAASMFCEVVLDREIAVSAGVDDGVVVVLRERVVPGRPSPRPSAFHRSARVLALVPDPESVRGIVSEAAEDEIRVVVVLFLRGHGASATLRNRSARSADYAR